MHKMPDQQAQGHRRLVDSMKANRAAFISVRILVDHESRETALDLSNRLSMLRSVVESI